MLVADCVSRTVYAFLSLGSVSSDSLPQFDVMTMGTCACAAYGDTAVHSGV